MGQNVFPRANGVRWSPKKLYGCTILLQFSGRHHYKTLTPRACSSFCAAPGSCVVTDTSFGHVRLLTYSMTILFFSRYARPRDLASWSATLLCSSSEEQENIRLSKPHKNKSTTRYAFRSSTGLFLNTKAI